LLLEHAFNALDLFKVNSRVIAFNTRSRRHNEKCGYELEGVLKNQVYKNGKRHDELIMSVSREGWQKAKKHVPKRS
jgi:RimJ/RimL family protein N-acetyltransferase